jgi:hypothetical protein
MIVYRMLLVNALYNPQQEYHWIVSLYMNESSPYTAQRNILYPYIILFWKGVKICGVWMGCTIGTRRGPFVTEGSSVFSSAHLLRNR